MLPPSLAVPLRLEFRSGVLVFLFFSSSFRCSLLWVLASWVLSMDAGMCDVEGQQQMEPKPHFQETQQLLAPVGDGDSGNSGVPFVWDGMVSDGMEGTEPLVGDAGGIGKLRLSFQGEDYVFDSVSTEKVQSVLVILGGQVVPGVPFRQNHWVSDDVPRSLNSNHRQASLMRFREKRKTRCFQKKIHYHVRKEVAQRMQRKKGQFVSSKLSSENVSSTLATSNLAQGSFLDDAHQEIFCQHCGCGQGFTPMMRRGPDGSNSLCNPCGLRWETKGTLKDLLKTPVAGNQFSSLI